MKRKGKAATPRQSAIMAAIADLTRELRRAPSATEIAARMGVTRVGLLPQLKALETKGLAGDVPKQVRSGKWRLTRKGRASINGLSALAEYEAEHGAFTEAELAEARAAFADPPPVPTAAELDGESWEDFPYIETPGELPVKTFPLSVLDGLDE